MSDGSSVPRRQLGRSLKQARERAGVTLEAASTEMEWSRAKLYRIEGGVVGTRALDVRMLCGLYGCPDDLTEALVALAKESKSKGWWHAYGDVIPAWFELYVGMESAASEIRQYEPSLVPGLLQTRDYVRAVVETWPGWADDPEEVERRVALRMERQKLLDRVRPPAPKMDYIIDEAVLRRRVGSDVSWRKQLERLAEVAAGGRKRMCLRVIPADRGVYAALNVGGPCVIMDFPPPEPRTVYCEGLTGALYLDKPTEVASYQVSWNQLSSIALDPGDSAKLIRQIWEER